LPDPERLTTTVSTKGQVILPKAVRERRGWSAGTRLLVEDTADGVLLKRAPAFAATRSEEVFGMLPRRVSPEADPRSDAPKSVEEMDAAVLLEARRRARD
jgi:AbrB family looped-hinge helix DNA binding protein